MIEVYKKTLKDRLNSERYEHCINVSKKAVYLAQTYDEDNNKAEIAGLLHDITKQTSEEEQLQLISDAGMELSQMEKENKKLWHAVSGTAYLKTKLNIRDEDILNAVKYHTTGRAGMSKLEKIIFLADLISDERNFDGVEKIRAIAKESLDKAVCVASIYSIDFLIKKKVPIAVNTIDAYNDTVKFLN